MKTQKAKSCIASVNPATGEEMKRFEPHSPREIERRLELAERTFQEYRRSAFAARSQSMMRAAELLETGKQALGKVMTLEMGKPLRAAVQEVEKCAYACRFYAENAEAFLADEEIPTGQGRNFVRCEPLGPVLAVMPWNFPFWQVIRFAAPALMAGNVGLLKHASNVPQCALAIEDVFRQAGFPAGAFQVLLVGSGAVERVIQDRRVRAVTLTGSVRAGASVAAAAGREIKKTVLELGGSDAFIVMRSANLDLAAAAAVKSRVINNGQSCIAAKRFIADTRIAGEFERLFVERMRALRVGDPMQEMTEIGPLATAEVLQSLETQVARSVRMGAKVLLGGKRIGGPGWFYHPTVLTRIPEESPAAREEIFGPVASMFRANDIGEAICLANDTSFGLGASIWTNDPAEQEQFIDTIECGVAVINDIVASDPRLPFGGVKQSGYGRELGRAGIREFMNIKTVMVRGGEGAEKARRRRTNR